MYVPNAGDNLRRIDYRTKYDEAFQKYVKSLEKEYKKPVIVAGDLNVCGNDLDMHCAVD